MLTRIALSLVLALLFGILFYFFVFYMPALEWEWRESDKELVLWEKLLITVSWEFGKYWYLPAFGTIVTILLILFVPISSERSEA